MRRNEAKRVDNILSEILSGNNFDKKLCELRAAEVWPEIVGPAVNRRTVELRVSNGVMLVRVTSAAMRQELTFHKEMLVSSINKMVGDDTIKDIKFF